MSVRVGAAVVAVAVALSGACGSGGSPDLHDIEARLGRVERGVLDLELVASSRAGTPVGFEVKGPFATARDATSLARIDLTTTRIAGATRTTSRVVSDGSRAWAVDPQAGATELPPAAASELRGGSGPGAIGLTGIRPSAWFPSSVKARTVAGGDGHDLTIYRGPVDAVAVLNDLVAISASGAGKQLRQLTADDAERVRHAVRRTTGELQAGKDDGLLRSLQVSIVFGADPEGQLARALGDLAGVTIRFDLSVEHPNEPVRITAPT